VVCNNIKVGLGCAASSSTLVQCTLGFSYDLLLDAVYERRRQGAVSATRDDDDDDNDDGDIVPVSCCSSAFLRQVVGLHPSQSSLML